MPLHAQPREEQGQRGHGHGGKECSRAKGSWALVDEQPRLLVSTSQGHGLCTWLFQGVSTGRRPV